MNNAAVVVSLKNVRKHPNADRLQLASCFGYTVIVGLKVKKDDIGIYFPDGTQIGLEFAQANNLLKSQGKGGFFEENRRVRTLKLRGERSEGFWIPLDSLKSLGDYSGLKANEEFHVFNGKEICIKYESPQQKHSKPRQQAKPENLMMPRHKDTEHLRMYVNNIQKGELIISTAKAHGTSFRVAKVLKQRPKTWWEKLLFFINPDLRSWEVITGSRNVVLGENCEVVRKNVRQRFEPLLRKGEAVYGEIVGFDPMPIMPTCKNDVLGKDFVKKWGETTTWSYGCAAGCFKILIYRITQANEDGFITELSWEQVKVRAEEMGMLTVHEYDKFIYDGDSDKLLEYAEKLSEGPDPLDPHHIKEGVVLRVERAQPKFVKHKSFEFKVLEGIVDPPEES